MPDNLVVIRRASEYFEAKMLGGYLRVPEWLISGEERKAKLEQTLSTAEKLKKRFERVLDRSEESSERELIEFEMSLIQKYEAAIRKDPDDVISAILLFFNIVGMSQGIMVFETGLGTEEVR